MAIAEDDPVPECGPGGDGVHCFSSAPEPSEISRITRSRSVCVDFDMSLMVSDGSAPFARMKIIGVRSSLSSMTSLKIYGAGFA